MECAKCFKKAPSIRDASHNRIDKLLPIGGMLWLSASAPH